MTWVYKLRKLSSTSMVRISLMRCMQVRLATTMIPLNSA